MAKEDHPKKLAKKHKTKQLISVQNVKEYGRSKIVYVEKVDGVKATRTITDPEITFFHSKPEFAKEHIQKMPRYVPVAEVEAVTVKFNTMFDDIIELIDKLDHRDSIVDSYIDHYNACIKGKLRKTELRELHGHPCIFQSDVDIADYYVKRYKIEAGDQLDIKAPLFKAYSDIEVDNTDYDDFPDEELAPCAIDSISLVLDLPVNECWLFLLRDPTNPLCLEFEKGKGVPALRKQLIKEFEVEDLKVLWFDDELELIESYFYAVNEKFVPDTISFWNMGFDARTFMNRIKQLAGEAAISSIMCPKEFSDNGQVFYWQDKNAKDRAEDKSSLTITSKTTWIDQMLAYASIRKTQGKKDSYALDSVLEDEIGQGKVDLEGVSLRRLRHEDYAKYAYYSCVDSLGLMKLEHKNKDFDLLYTLSIMSNARFQKARTKTITLKMMALDYFNDRGIVAANNANIVSLNREKVRKEHKFRGAIVADPSLLTPGQGEVIYDNPTDLVFKRAIDFDFSSMYPRIIISGNMDPSTMYGKLVLTGPSGSPFVNPDLPEDEAPIEYAQEFMDTFASGSMIAVGSKWMDLPDESEIMSIISQVEE